ncbi:MAG: twin-arginine translocation signal domain-containing protein, partial [Planctomycetota bacterium]
MSNPTRREFLRTVGFAAASAGALSVLSNSADAGQAGVSGKKRP